MIPTAGIEQSLIFYLFAYCIQVSMKLLINKYITTNEQLINH